MGFKVMLWVCPYITPDGLALRLDNSGRGKGLGFPTGNRHLPAIMQWWDGFSAVADVTSPQGREWLTDQLRRLVDTYGVDGFKFDGGDADTLRRRQCWPAQCARRDSPRRTVSPRSSPKSASTIRSMNTGPCGRWAVNRRERLRDKNHTWEDLRKLVPGILNQGLMGYPFSCPDMIGGGEYYSFQTSRDC